MITDCGVSSMNGFSSASASASAASTSTSTSSASTASSVSTTSDALTLTTTAASSWCAIPASTRLRVLRLIRPPHARRLLVAPDRPASFGFAVRGGREHGTGFFVSSVERNSEADLKGLRAGDQILRINGYRVDDAVHKEFVQFASGLDRLTLKVRGVGMLPVKDASDERLAWHVVKLKSVSNTPSEQSYRCKDVAANHSHSHSHNHNHTPPNTINVVLNVAPRTKLGLGICKGPEWKPGIFVQFTKEKSVAREAGLRPGDQLLSVNSIDFADVLFSEAVAVMKGAHKLEMVVRTAAGCDLFPGESSGYNSSASSVTGDQSPCWADAKSKRLTAVREESAACIYGELRRHVPHNADVRVGAGAAGSSQEVNKTIIKLSDTGTSINNTYIASATCSKSSGDAVPPPPPPAVASPKTCTRTVAPESHYSVRRATMPSNATLLVDVKHGTLPTSDGRRRILTAAAPAPASAAAAATSACRNGRNHHHNANDAACNGAATVAAAAAAAAAGTSTSTTAAAAAATTSLSDAITEALKKRQEKQRLNAAMAAASGTNVDGNAGNAADAGDNSQRCQSSSSTSGGSSNCGNRARSINQQRDLQHQPQPQPQPGSVLRRQVSSPAAASSSVLVQHRNVCSASDVGGGVGVGAGVGGIARATSSAANCNSSNSHHYHNNNNNNNNNNSGSGSGSGSQVVGDQHSALMDEFKRAHQRMFRHGFHENEPRNKERQEALRRTTIMEDDVAHRSGKDRPNTNGDRSAAEQHQQQKQQPQQQVASHIPPPPPQFANSPPKVNGFARTSSNSTSNSTIASSNNFRSLQRHTAPAANQTKPAASVASVAFASPPKPPQSPVPDYDNVRLRGATMPTSVRANSMTVNSAESASASASSSSSSMQRRTVRLGTVVIGEYDQRREQRETPGRFDFIAAQKRNTFDTGSLQAELQSTLSRTQLRQGKEHHRSDCPAASRARSGSGSGSAGAAANGTSTGMGTGTGTGTGTGILKNGNRNSGGGGAATKSAEKTITFGN